MHFYCEDFIAVGLATSHCLSCHAEADYYDEEGWGYALPEVEYGEHTAHVCCTVGDIIGGMTVENWGLVIAHAKKRIDG